LKKLPGDNYERPEVLRYDARGDAGKKS